MNILPQKCAVEYACKGGKNDTNDMKRQNPALMIITMKNSAKSLDLCAV